MGCGVTEARVMANTLLEMGVEEDRLVLEEEAKHTMANALNVLRMVADMRRGEEVMEVVVVTSAYHMPRAAWTFRVVAAAVGAAVALGQQAVEGKEGDVLALRGEERITRAMPGWMARKMRERGLEVEGIEGVEGPLAEIRRMIGEASSSVTPPRMGEPRVVPHL